MWFDRKAIYIASFLGLIHVASNLYISGIISFYPLFRAVSFLLIAAVAGSLSAIRKEAEGRYSSLVENIIGAVLVINPDDYTIVTANRAALEQVRMMEEGVVGRTCHEVIHRRSTSCGPPEHVCPIREMMETGRCVTVEHTHYDEDGNPLWVEVSVYPVKDAEGNIIQAVYVSREITERKRLERMEMRERERMDNFISMVTHELRTPLVSIKGFLDLIQTGRAGVVPVVIGRQLEVVQRNAIHLLSITEDLLDIQRIKSGKLELVREAIDMRALIDHCVEEVRPFIEERGQKLIVEASIPPIPVNGDPVRLCQVMMNLLSNANKFTPEGGVITLTVEDLEDEVSVRVSDTGIGIKTEELKRVFDSFAAIEKPLYVKGTGIGLSISKGLVEAHGGRIWAESQGPGKGATFTFTLPKPRREG